MFVGGEFYYDQHWKAEKPSLSTDGMLFLNGGTACLVVICAYLLDHGIRKMLLPSYLCPSIVSTLEHCSMQYGYYRVNRDLSMDVNDLAEKVSTHQAVYLINYFGFLQPPDVRNYLLDLRQKGVVIVEDNAQAGFNPFPTGDFIFNSMRKLVPYDGGYLITNVDLQSTLDKFKNRPNHRLPIIREYRKKLYSYLAEGHGDYDELAALFSISERYYVEDFTVLGDPQEKEHIEHLDWAGIKKIRWENYSYLLSLIRDIPEISPIFPVLQDGIMPLGLPVYFSRVSRDRVNEKLGEAGIGLTIHWDEMMVDPRTNCNPMAVEMASTMLTLTIDQRTSRAQLDYLYENLKAGIASAMKL
ncbi:MAG: hypothetical protein C0391_06520 [Anaerolinea sp.]|nr:hypothetical protein [Anaerolinea sp.]